MDRKPQSAAQGIALAALSLDRSEREAYLRWRTAGDPEVLAEVRRRIELADDMPDDFLDQPAAELNPEAPADEPSAAVELRELPCAEGRRYSLGEILGAGGMAEVFRAVDQRLDRPVAVKHLRQSLIEDPQALWRFEREARAAAKVSHPAIVQVFDVLDDGDDLWIVMELVPGQSLAGRFAEGPLELGEALVLAADVAGGLAAAHARGIVHRDLKAGNVMVTPEGRAKILDFGLAKSTTPDEDSTADGGVCGTAHAMSPEQVTGAQVDARSDLFSFGSLLYEMVTGEQPFRGSSPVVTLARVCGHRPPQARRLNPRVPQELSSLIEALLEKEPARRPQDTAAVARTLTRLAESMTGDAAAMWTYGGERRPGPASAAFPSAAAERREITVLNCQLVASGGRPFDPEKLLEIEAAFRDLAVPILDRHRGHPGERLDAGLTAYFGYPAAHEDDPRQAVAAALELVAAVGVWSAGSGVRLRAGVHTGPVVTTKAPDGRQEIVLGHTACRANGMRIRSGAGAVLVSAATHRLVRGHFRCESLGASPLPCCRDPFAAYRVLTARRGRSGNDPLTPFVGREAELELLRKRWRQAAEGRGQAVLLSGEAGSGKSRLVRVLRERLAVEPGTWLEGFCRPDASPAPLARALRQTAGCEGDEEPAALMRRLAERAAGQAAVLAIEDVHLADPSDLELLDLLIDRAPAARVLILLTCRPPFNPPWKLPPHLSVCSLGPLTTGQVKQIIGHFSSGAALPAAAEDRILAAADGVPRFVEELTREILGWRELAEEGAASQTGGGELAGPLPPTIVPASLRSFLTARLDQLGSAREVARVASVLGRELTREQLSALDPAAGDVLEPALERLVEAEILHRGRHDTYRFRHALVRDAAYESLIGEHQRLYERRAAAMTRDPPEAPAPTR